MSLACQATGQPKPTITWRKAVGQLSQARSQVINGNLTILNVTRTDGGDCIYSAKNLLNEDSTVAQVTVVDELRFVLLPPHRLFAAAFKNVKLNCEAEGAAEIVWKRSGQPILQNHVLYANGTLLLKDVSLNSAGTYTCIAKNFLRSIRANTALQVSIPVSCSDVISRVTDSLSDTYMIDPDGKGAVTPVSVYCDMRDKNRVGVTVIGHDSESRTHVANLPGCGGNGCYSKDVRYTGVSTAQLAALTRVSQNCEQFIKFECHNDIAFIEDSYAWWVSRNGTRMNYWGGATGHDKMCACGVTNSCTGGTKCNCDNYGSGWYEDSGLLTDKSALPVTQIRLGDLDDSNEEGYHTLGKLKCYGQA